MPNPSIFTGSNESGILNLRNQHFLMVSYRGDIALLSNMNISVPDAPWCLHKLWTHGHVGIVRSLLWDEDVGSVSSLLLSLISIYYFRTTHWLLGAKTAR